MSSNYELRTTGRKEKFDTGSQRDSNRGRGRFDLIPAMVLFRDAILYEKGAEKYGDDNWQKGQPSKRYAESIFRHYVCYMIGDRKEDHLAALRWNAGGIEFNEYMSAYAPTQELRERFKELHNLKPLAYLPDEYELDDLYAMLGFFPTEREE